MRLKLKIVSIALLIGLSLLKTEGAVLSQETNNPQASSLAELVETCKETQAQIIESALRTLQSRYDALTERKKDIQTVFNLFNRHSQAPMPEGYACIKEDLEALPDTEARSEALLNLENLIVLINSGTLSEAGLANGKSKLDQRKNAVLETRRAIIAQRQRSCGMFLMINRVLLTQIAEAFNKDLEKLKRYRNEETTSLWTLESLLPAEPSTATEENVETGLPLLADAIRDYLTLEKDIKNDEIRHLQRATNLLITNRSKLQALLDQTLTLSATETEQSQLGDLRLSLEQEIAQINKFITRDQNRLNGLGEPQQ